MTTTARAQRPVAHRPAAVTLAAVAAVGVDPTGDDTDRARQTFALVRQVGDLHTYEAGNAAAAGRGLARAVLAGDADQVAYWIRQLRAFAAASDERADALCAAAATDTAGGTS